MNTLSDKQDNLKNWTDLIKSFKDLNEGDVIEFETSEGIFLVMRKKAEEILEEIK